MKAKTRILNFLKTVPEASRTTIYIATKVPYYLLLNELKELEADGYVTSRMNDTESYVYYKLKSTPSLEGENKLNGGE